MIEVLFNISLGLAGLVIMTLFTAAKYFKEGFSIKDFVYKGKWTWIWVTLMLVTILPLIHFVPATAEIIKQGLGLDVGNSPAAFVSLGMGLTAARKAVKDIKQGIKKVI